MFSAVEDLDPASTLARATAAVRARHAADLDELELACHWADLHGSDPQRRPGAVPAWAGGDRLIEYGGDGTPAVQELCSPELAVALGLHTTACNNLIADALDLRHRLPLTWQVLRERGGAAWVARKVARLSRRLDRHQVALVDAAVAEALPGQSPGRVLRIAEAKVIEADQEAHAARLEAARRERYVRLSRTDEHGLRHVIARVEAGDAVWIDALVAQVVDALRQRPDLTTELPDQPSTDELRAVAFGWLAHPEQLVDLLTAAPTDDSRPTRRRVRRDALLHVHLHESALAGAGVARVESLGPMLVDQVRRLLRHASVTVVPVVDLEDRRSVNGYEHPTDIAERTHLRTCGEVFPHATSTSRRVDLDHASPYRPNGPPGQTGDHNAAPLGRRNHRAKTHLGYHVQQLGLGDYLWRTPHGLERRVTGGGTGELDPARAVELADPGALDRALDRVERRLVH